MRAGLSGWEYQSMGEKTGIATFLFYQINRDIAIKSPGRLMSSHGPVEGLAAIDPAQVFLPASHEGMRPD